MSINKLWIVAALVTVVGGSMDALATTRAQYQTTDVWDALTGPDTRLGAATLTRWEDRISGRIMTNVPTAGDPYTLWGVVFNNPAACEDGCNDEDLGNPDVEAAVYNLTGAISAANGNGGGVLNMDFVFDAGPLPLDQFVLFPPEPPNGLRAGSGFSAEIHLVVDRHPPIAIGADSWVKDLTETNFPGTGPVMSVAVGIFLPPEPPASGNTVSGFAWIDGNADGVRQAEEAAEAGRMLTLFRCSAPWGEVGTAITDASGEFSIALDEPTMVQLGTSAADTEFSPLDADNDVFSNGFTNCVTAGSGEAVGIGVVP